MALKHGKSYTDVLLIRNLIALFERRQVLLYGIRYFSTLRQTRLTPLLPNSLCNLQSVDINKNQTFFDVENRQEDKNVISRSTRTQLAGATVKLSQFPSEDQTQHNLSLENSNSSNTVHLGARSNLDIVTEVQTSTNLKKEQWKPFPITFVEANTSIRCFENCSTPTLNEEANRILTDDGEIVLITRQQYYDLCNVNVINPPMDSFVILTLLSVWKSHQPRSCQNLLYAVERIVKKYSSKRGPLRLAILLGFKGILEERLQIIAKTSRTTIEVDKRSHSTCFDVSNDSSEKHSSNSIFSDIQQNRKRHNELTSTEAIKYLWAMARMSAIDASIVNLCMKRVVDEIALVNPASWNSTETAKNCKCTLIDVCSITWSIIRLRLPDQGLLNSLITKIISLNQCQASGKTLLTSLLDEHSSEVIRILWAATLHGSLNSFNEDTKQLAVIVINHQRNELIKASQLISSMKEDDYKAWEVENDVGTVRSSLRIGKSLLHRELRASKNFFDNSKIQLLQIFVSESMKSPQFQDCFDECVLTAIHTVSKINAFNTVNTESHRKVMTVLRTELNLPYDKEYALEDIPGVVVDIAIRQLDENRKNEFVKSIIGVRGMKRLAALDQLIADFEIPFRTTNNRIAIEVDGSYHYVQNMNKLVFRNGKADVSESLGLEVLQPYLSSRVTSFSHKTEIKKPQPLSITGNRDNHGDGIHNELSFVSGPTYWKQRVLQSSGWFQVQVPVHELKIHRLSGNIKGYLMKSLPINWNTWQLNIDTLKSLYQEEQQLNL